MDGENKIGIYTYFDFRICIWKVIRMQFLCSQKHGSKKWMGKIKLELYTYFDFRICIWKVIRMKSSDDKNPGIIVLCRVTINVPISSQ